MDEGKNHIWKRTLPAAHHVALCDHYQLRRFLPASKGRREQYFAMVDAFHTTLKRAPCGSSDHLLLKAMALALGEDRTFLSFVTRHGGTEEARDPERWQRVLEAGAGAIIGEYLTANGNLT
jgi:hypothetical protein